MRRNLFELPWLLALMIAACRSEPATTSPPAPTAVVAPAPSCMPVAAALDQARASLAAGLRESYRNHGLALDDALTCSEGFGGDLGWLVAELLTEMSEQLHVKPVEQVEDTEDAEARQVLLVRARRRYAEIAQFSADATIAAEAARLQLELTERALVAMRWLERAPTLAAWHSDEGSNLRNTHHRLSQLFAEDQALRARDEAREGGRRGWPPAVYTDGFERCATGLLHVFEAFPGHEAADQLLWDAADCFVLAGQAQQAAEARRTLVERFPESHLVQPSLSLLATYELERMNLEAAAMQAQILIHGPTPVAIELLPLSYEVAVPFGHDIDGLAVTHLASPKIDRDPLARARWGARPTRDAQTQLHHAEAFLREHADDWLLGKVDALRVAAQSSWDLACRRQLYAGLCISRLPLSPATARRPPHSAGRVADGRSSARACPLPAILPTLADRLPRRRAQAHAWRDRLEAALAGTWPRVPPVVSRAKATAHVLALDAAFEDLAALDLGQPSVEPRADELVRGYLQVAAASRVPLAEIQALERLAMLTLMRLRARMSPRAATCEPSSATARQLWDQATAYYASCLERARDHGLLDATAERCAAALTLLSPDLHPPHFEFLGTPDLAPPAAAPLTVELASGRPRRGAGLTPAKDVSKRRIGSSRGRPWF